MPKVRPMICMALIVCMGIVLFAWPSDAQTNPFGPRPTPDQTTSGQTPEQAPPPDQALTALSDEPAAKPLITLPGPVREVFRQVADCSAN